VFLYVLSLQSTDGDLLVVLAFYAQGGGKAGAHKWQSDTQTIGTISYLVTQVYENAHH
jgi:hypothetical protein